MTKMRRTAIIVGVLFIIATLFYIVGDAISGSVLSSPDYLETAYPGRATILTGVLIGLIAALAIALIPVYMYSLLKEYNQSFALGYVVFRAMEALLIVIALVGPVVLVDLSEAYLSGARGSGESLYRIGATILSLSEWSFTFSITVFGLGALMFYWVLYSSRLVPRFLSLWGFLGAAWMVVGIFLGLFDANPLPQPYAELVFTTAIAVNEMVLAVWLIAKGFNPVATAAHSAPVTKSGIGPAAVGETA